MARRGSGVYSLSLHISFDTSGPSIFHIYQPCVYIVYLFYDLKYEIQNVYHPCVYIVYLFYDLKLKTPNRFSEIKQYIKRYVSLGLHKQFLQNKQERKKSGYEELPIFYT